MGAILVADRKFALADDDALVLAGPRRSRLDPLGQVVLLLDTSPSTAYRIEEIQNAALAFIKLLNGV